MSDEIVAVFDAAGAAVGSAPRSQVYADGLWHAGCGVLVRSRDGERIYVHRRSARKRVFAGMHDCLAGGVMDPGETAEQTATRELAEELGVTGVPLRPLGRASWDGTWAGKPLRCHLFAFEIRHDGPLHHQPEEIVAGWWWTDAQLRARLADPRWAFVPDTRVLIPQILA